MAETPLTKKLGIKPGCRVLIVNAPAGYRARLEPLPASVALAEAPAGVAPAEFAMVVTHIGVYDVVQLFARDKADLQRHAPAAMAALKPGGIMWFAFPKQSSGQSSDLTRDSGWDIVTRTGLRPVTAIAIDEVWSALRFRPASAVVSRAR